MSIPVSERPFALVLLHARGGAVRHGETGADHRRPPRKSRRLAGRGLRRPPYFDRRFRQFPRISGGRRGDRPDRRRAADRSRSPRRSGGGLPFALRQERRGGAAGLLLRTAERLRRESRTDGYRARRFPPLYLPRFGGGQPDLQHRHEDGRKRSCARRFGDLHRGRPYRGLGGDRTRLCGHLSEGRRREDVFQRRRGCRTCVVGRLLRRGGFCR